MASKSNRRRKDRSKMGKGSVRSEFETVQLCAAWLATSEDPIRGAGQKKATFFERVYEQWRKNVGSDADQRSEKAIAGRWKKMQPDVTKFEGIFLKLKSQERSGWSEPMYVENAAKIFQERTKQPFEYLAAWRELRDKPKWTKKTNTTGNKRKSAEPGSLARPEGQKAAKKRVQSDTGLPDDVHARFVAASEKKADILEQQLRYSLFMQAPDSDESKEYFSLRRKAILAQLRASESEAVATRNAGFSARVTSRSAANRIDEENREQTVDGCISCPSQSSFDKENNPNTSAPVNAGGDSLETGLI